MGSLEADLLLCNDQIQELVSVRLLIRTTPPERPDASSMYKCAISYERALALARHLDIALNELLWETN
jgi:origin recognition complex subunit 5